MYDGYANEIPHVRRDRVAATDDGTINEAAIAALLESQDFECAICHLVFTEAPGLDHIIPLSRGGAHTISNIQLACRPCNYRKGARLPSGVSEKRSILIDRYFPHEGETGETTRHTHESSEPGNIVASFLTKLRLESGLIQTELAVRLNTRQQFVSRVESNIRRIDVVEFYAYCRALALDPTETIARLYQELPEDVGISVARPGQL